MKLRSDTQYMMLMPILSVLKSVDVYHLRGPREARQLDLETTFNTALNAGNLQSTFNKEAVEKLVTGRSTEQLDLLSMYFNEGFQMFTENHKLAKLDLDRDQHLYDYITLNRAKFQKQQERNRVKKEGEDLDPEYDPKVMNIELKEINGEYFNVVKFNALSYSREHMEKREYNSKESNVLGSLVNSVIAEEGEGDHTPQSLDDVDELLRETLNDAVSVMAEGMQEHDNFFLRESLDERDRESVMGLLEKAHKYIDDFLKSDAVELLEQEARLKDRKEDIQELTHITRALLDVKELLDGTTMKEVLAVMNHMVEGGKVNQEDFLAYVDYINSVMGTAKEIVKNLKSDTTYEELKAFMEKREELRSMLKDASEDDSRVDSLTVLSTIFKLKVDKGKLGRKYTAKAKLLESKLKKKHPLSYMDELDSWVEADPKERGPLLILKRKHVDKLFMESGNEVHERLLDKVDELVENCREVMEEAWEDDTEGYLKTLRWYILRYAHLSNYLQEAPLIVYVSTTTSQQRDQWYSQALMRISSYNEYMKSRLEEVVRGTMKLLDDYIYFKEKYDQNYHGYEAYNKMRHNLEGKTRKYVEMKNGVVDVTDQFLQDLKVYGYYFGVGNFRDKGRYTYGNGDRRFREKELYNSRYAMLLKNYGPKADGLHPLQKGEMRKQRQLFRTFKSLVDGGYILYGDPKRIFYYEKLLEEFEQMQRLIPLLQERTLVVFYSSQPLARPNLDWELETRNKLLEQLGSPLRVPKSINHPNKVYAKPSRGFLEKPVLKSKTRYGAVVERMLLKVSKQVNSILLKPLTLLVVTLFTGFLAYNELGRTVLSNRTILENSFDFYNEVGYLSNDKNPEPLKILMDYVKVLVELIKTETGLRLEELKKVIKELQ